MVPVLVLLTFAVLVALDYFVFRKGYLEERTGWPANLENLPLSAAHDRIPAGVFLQPTYTWSRIGEWGGVYIGVHPMLLRLVGEAGELELRAPGEHVAKGDALVRVGLAGRRLTLRSPVSGRVDRLNRHAAGTPWREIEGEGSPWLYRVKPEAIAEEKPQWFSGEAALEWTHRQYQQLRAYLQDVITGGHVGTVMADGGELPVGILGQLDEGVWTGLQDRFLAEGGGSGAEGRR